MNHYFVFTFEKLTKLGSATMRALFSLHELLTLEERLSSVGIKSKIMISAVQLELPIDPLVTPAPRGVELGKPDLTVVIPVHAKDVRWLPLCVEGVNRHANPIEILIAANDMEPIQDRLADHGWPDGAPIRLISETDVIARADESGLIHKFDGRKKNWVLQQILKMQLAAESSHPVLALDSDTILVAQRTFFSTDQTLLLVGADTHRPYWKHIRAYFGTTSRLEPLSFVTHHQAINPQIMREMLARFGGISRWLHLGLNQDFTESPVSEYQTYGSYHYRFHRNQAVLGQFSNRNASNSEFELASLPPSLALDILERSSSEHVHSVSFHSYIR